MDPPEKHLGAAALGRSRLEGRGLTRGVSAVLENRPHGRLTQLRSKFAGFAVAPTIQEVQPQPNPGLFKANEHHQSPRLGEV